MPDTYHWLDVQRIAEELVDRFPDADPYGLNFVELRRTVETLPGFHAQPGHPPNERILEEIQRLWHEERVDLRGEDDD
jgi:FeS assembly protein IscX